MSMTLQRAAHEDWEPFHPDTDGRLIYALGDIHGRYDLLSQILKGIAADVRQRRPQTRPLLVLCGDYVDRGAQSALVLEALVWLQRRTDLEVRVLKGNHEQALLDFIVRPEDGADWIRFGGAQTLQSYGVEPPGPDTDLAGVRDALLRAMPPSHLVLLNGLETMVCVGDYAFVHAGIRPGVPLALQEDRDLLWIRDEFLDAPGPFEKIIVHGHTWRDGVQVLEHRIGLDTGAYATGVLTAARLDEDGVAILDTVTGRPHPEPAQRWGASLDDQPAPGRGPLKLADLRALFHPERRPLSANRPDRNGAL